MQATYELQFLFSLFFTVAIETTVLWLLLRRVLKKSSKSIPFSLVLFAGFVASFSTLPYLWFVFPAFFAQTTYIALAEGFAVAVEAVEYFFILKTPAKQSFVISLACNAASFCIGWIVFSAV